MDMAEPIVNELLILERGVWMFDSYLKEEALVLAPVMCLLADNPRHSELCNHFTGNPRKYCMVNILCMTHSLQKKFIFCVLFSQTE